MVTCKSVAETPYAFRWHLSGTSGHSQGIITAVVTAAADTRESFGSVSRSALITLFWIGVRSQQTYPQDNYSSSNGQGFNGPRRRSSNANAKCS